MSKDSFPLRMHEDDRTRGKRLSEELSVSENRLYNELIHDGLLVREQMNYMAKLREIAATTTADDALAVLGKVPPREPVSTDTY